MGAQPKWVVTVRDRRVAIHFVAYFLKSLNSPELKPDSAVRDPNVFAPQAHFVQESAGYLGSRQRMSGDTSSIDNAGLRGDMDGACSLSESF